MPAYRMNRDEFFRKVAPLDAEDLRKALWTLYWRGTADVRSRVEAALAGDGTGATARPARQPVCVSVLKGEVDEFVMLARRGAYMAGDRRVSPRERTRWRFTFKRLTVQARDALSGQDHEGAAAILEKLIDLADETRDHDYFRSEDAMEAAGFVVSDAVAMLWTTVLAHHGFQAFAEYAAAQLIRWESPYGWTRFGMGRIAAKETTLAEVLTGMVRVADTWETFAEQYVLALDALATARPGRDGERRAQRLAQWHRRLLDNLDDTPGGVLDRVAEHAALGGPEQKFFAARLALRRDDIGTARKLVQQCLQKLPGHQEFRKFAAEVGA